MSVLDATRQRTAFTDALRPPPGYVLGAGIGTTYSLDFEPFTAVLLALVGADSEESLNDPPAVLTTVARLKDRLRVFVNSGSLHSPTAPTKLFALYDRILRPVAIKGGAFHPKVWVLRFDPIARPERRDVEPIYRVLTASRNVSDSGCWELGVRLEGAQSGAKQKFGSDVSAFCQEVAGSPKLPPDIWKLINELREVEFLSPREAVAGLRFEWQWPNQQQLINRIPRNADRALVISPFVRAAFLDEVVSRVKELTIVSTQAELDCLSESTHQALANADLYVVTTSDDGDGAQPQMDLHAKLFAWETSGESETLVGSANATGPGWGCGHVTNCEALVSLKPGLSIDGVLKAFVSPSKGQLHGWVEQYERQPPIPDEAEEATKRLEKLKRALCADPIRVQYSASQSTLTFSSRTSPKAPDWPDGVRGEVVPLLQRDLGQWQDYRRLAGAGAVFGGIQLEDVCAFLCVVLRDSAHEGAEISFVLQCELNLNAQEAEARDVAVNHRLLDGVDARSLLLNVLTGLIGGISRPSGSRNKGNGSKGESLLRRASIERILEACTADPSRVHEVEAVIRACGDLDDMSSFREFWDVFRASLSEERDRVDA